MKFGQHLASHMTPEWISQYIAYERMKELLEEATSEAPPVAASSSSSEREEYFLLQDVSFFEFCAKQLKKINAFFAEKLAEALRRLETLKEDLQYVKSTTANGPTGRVSVVVEDATNSTDNDAVYRTGADKLTTQKRRVGSLADIMSRRLGKGRSEQGLEERHFKTLNNLKTAFSELYLMLVLLQNYQVLNFTGFQKILKKHDKVFQTRRGEEWRKVHVETARFHLSTEVTDRIREVEDIFTRELEAGDRAEAMKRLRVPPLEEKSPPIVAFRVGLFVGMVCLLLPALFALAIQLNTSRSYERLAWREALLLYRSTCLVIVQIIFAGINVYGWSSSGVNHILIFEIDPRHHLSFPRILEIGISLFALWFLSFTAFILASYYDYYPFVHPLIFIAFIILFLLNPLPVFYRDARFWFIRKLARVFSAPFHPVGFTDFWLGDQLTSVELVFFDIQAFFCFYASDHAWWSTDLTSPAYNQGVFCTGWSKFFLQAVLLMLPSWFRFAQCVRRYRDTKHAYPHLLNAGKYATGFFVAITNVLRRATATSYANSKASNPFLYSWIFAAIVGSTYKLVWDLKMDWGFFDKKAGLNKYLREQLVYSSRLCYYLAIAEDVVLRFAWVINIFIHFDDSSEEYADLVGFCFGFAEIFRRFVWNFFRLENEHLNNCGEFRAVRDISIVPMATEVDYKLIDFKMSRRPGIRRRNRVMPKQAIIDEENTSITDFSTYGEATNDTSVFVQNRIPADNSAAVGTTNDVDKQLQLQPESDVRSFTPEDKSSLLKGEI